MIPCPKFLPTALPHPACPLQGQIDCLTCVFSMPFPPCPPQLKASGPPPLTLSTSVWDDDTKAVEGLVSEQCLAAAFLAAWAEEGGPNLAKLLVRQAWVWRVQLCLFLVSV